METEPLLSAAEARVLGALIEKQLTTPDYYPLSLNALTAACNQKSNRHPVVDYDDKTVARALQALRDRNLARMVSGADIRTPKYYHLAAEQLELNAAAVAVLGVLLLRGAQTIGEIRGRTGRMHAFTSLDEVEATLRALAEREPRPLILQLPRQPGQKEWRFAHLLCGTPEAEAAPAPELPEEPAMRAVQSENERVAQLQRQVEDLQERMAALEAAFAQFRQQFE